MKDFGDADFLRHAALLPRLSLSQLSKLVRGLVGHAGTLLLDGISQSRAHAKLVVADAIEGSAVEFRHVCCLLGELRYLSAIRRLTNLEELSVIWELPGRILHVFARSSSKFRHYFK
jgi:hypothetical protein